MLDHDLLSYCTRTPKSCCDFPLSEELNNVVRRTSGRGATDHYGGQERGVH